MRLKPLVRKLKSRISDFLRGGTRVGGALALAALTFYGVHWHLKPYIQHHEYFDVRSVRVSCDNPAVSPQALAAAAGLFRDTTIWEVDTEAAERALEDVSWVEAATVTRRFPRQVRIRVDRRQATAATMVNHRAYLVDSQARIFLEPGLAGYPDLPYLYGWNEGASHEERARRLHTLLRIVDASLEAGHPVSEVGVDAEGDYWMFPEQPTASVRLGAAPDIDAALARLDIAMSKLGDGVEDAREIDVSNRARIVVKAVDASRVRYLTARMVAGSDVHPSEDLRG